MAAKGVTVNVHHVRDAKPKEMPPADLYLFSSPGRFGKPIGDMRRFLKDTRLPSGTKCAILTTELQPVPDKKGESLMDMWKFFDITHREHIVCNPTSIEKLEQLVTLVRLKPDAHVLEIATGKGEFIIRLAERYVIEGVGVDLSPYHIADAKRKHQKRVPDARLTFLEMDGADFKPEKLESFDLVACIGASWIYGGHRGTLKALEGMAARESWIVVGEPYWRHEPEREYLEAIGEQRNSFGTHSENAEAGKEFGLEVAYTLVSSQDDWDRYEGLQWYAAEEWAAGHAGDSDVEEVLKRVREGKAAYLRWGRETLGWAIYVFKKGGLGR